MAKDKNIDKTTKKSTEELLMEMTNSNTEKQEQIEEPKEIKSLVKSSKDELQDLTSEAVQSSKPLTETDYLILEQHCKGTSEEVICQEFNITKGYFNSLLRNSNSNNFIDKYVKTTQNSILTKGIGTIANAWDKKSQKINKLLAEGKDDMAFYEMFGKLSYIEVQEKLAKMQSEEEEDNQAPMQNLFINLQQR